MKEKMYLAIACFILAAVILFKITPQAEAQHAVTGPGSGQFMLVAHSNNNAAAGVFRIDSETGAVSYCFVSGTTVATVTCTAPVQ